MTRNEEIKKQLNSHLEDLFSLNKKWVGLFLQGSQNYGLDLYTEEYKSDVDTKAILLPSLRDVCSNAAPISETFIRKNNEHIDLKDIRLMFETFKKQNINFVEILFTDFKIINPIYSDYFKEIDSFKEDFVRANPAQNVKTMAGMSMEKFKALKHPYPAIKHKIDKWGYDGKQLSHIIRLNDFIKRYIAGEEFKKCLIPSENIRDIILEAKLNKFSLKDAEKLAKEYDEDTKQMKEIFVSKYESYFNPDPYLKMDEIRTEILMLSFKNELRSENYE